MFGSLSTKIAHSTALGNQDLRLLQDAINKEKDFITTAQRLSKDLGISGDAFKQWGGGEGEDLADIGYSAMVLCNHATVAISTYADHVLSIRGQLKDLRTKEEQLDELRRRRKTVGGKLEAQERRVSKMSSENKQLSLANEQFSALQNEIRQLDTSILHDMARLSDHKRTITRSILLLRFGGFAELGEKLCIIGEMGKLLAEEVPQVNTPPGQGRPPYMARNATASLVSDATRLVSEVAFSAHGDPDFPAKQSLARKAVSNEDYGPNTIGLDVGSRFGEKPQTPLSQPGSQLPISKPVTSGTMPALRDSEKGQANYGGPMDEFGRPIDGLPPQANTMPPLRQGGSQFRRTPGYPIEQVPLDSIQGSMRSSFDKNDRPSSAGSAASSNAPSRFAAPAGGPPGRMGHAPTGSGSGSGFVVPPGPPPTGSHLRPQQPQLALPKNQGGASVERGLTLSLPVRSPAPEENEDEEPKRSNFRVGPAQQPSNIKGPDGGHPLPPSSFRQPAQTVQRQETTDSDIVLAEGDTNLQRVPTRPPTLGMPKIGGEEGFGEFPEWSLGLGEFGSGENPVKEKAGEVEEEKKEDTADSPPPPPELASKSSAGEGGSTQTTLSAVPKHLQQGLDSAPGSPLVQTPSTYSATGSAPGSQAQTPTAGVPPTATFIRGGGPSISHTNVVDNPTTRVSGSSGQFSQFPVKRKPVNMSLNDDSNAATPTPGSGSNLPPPELKFAAHPGLQRRPSPYPGDSVLSGVSPVPTPGSERPGSSGTQGSMLDFIPPNFDGDATEPPPRSILVGSQYTEGSSSQPASRSGTAGSGTEIPKLRFAPRPPSPITPSPVSPSYQMASAWASGESFADDKKGAGGGAIGGGNSSLSPGLGVSHEDADSPSSEAQYATRRSDANRLSVISPLEIHKAKDGSSLPGTPAKSVYTGEPDLSEDELSAMIDSLAAQVGRGSSPNTSSNPHSAIQSRQNSSLDTNASINTSARSMTLNTDDVSLDDIYGSPDEPEQSGTNAVTGSSYSQHAPAVSQPARSPSLSANFAPQISAPSPRSSSLKYSNSPSVSPLPSPLLEAPAARNGPNPSGNDRPSYVPYVSRAPPGPHDREDSTDSYSEENRPRTINASAFGKRGGGLPSHPSQGRLRDDPGAGRGISSGRSTPDSARGTPSSQHAHLPPQGQQPHNRGQLDQPTITPRQYDRSIPPAQYQPGQPVVYNGGIPQGAAPPSRYGAPGDPVYEQQRQSPPQGYPNTSPPNGMYQQQQQGYGAGPGTPISPATSSGPHIPSSLIPGRPGSAAPLAPIGITGPGPRNYASSPGGLGNMGGGYSSQGPQPPPMQSYPSSNVTAPWQQGPRPAYQAQYSTTPTPNNMLPPPGQGMQRGPSPMTGEFDGSRMQQDAYGSFADSPYGDARNANPAGPGGYGRGGPPMRGVPPQGRGPVGPGYGRGGW